MPNSILWIGLVVLWVFVLFPILADRHPRIRQTTDTALATRVLHRGGSKRRTRSGPAAGHESDPDWRPRRVQRKRPHSDDAEDRMTTSADEPVTEADEEQNTPGDVTETGTSGRSTATRRAVVETDLDDTDAAEADIDDADVSDDAEADSRADGAEYDDRDDHHRADRGNRADYADGDDEADHDDYNSRADHDAADSEPDPVSARIPPARAALPAVADADHDTDDAEDTDFIPTRRGRGGFDPEADAIARAARYTFRQRAVLGLLLGTILCGALAVAIAPTFWWGCGLAAGVLVTYLAYLRKQVRMEEDIRRRRSARLARTQRPEQEGTEQAAPAPRRGMDRDTARALRRRSDLLETDDEDPAFEHLEAFDATAARAVRNRAAGGDMRRAAGQ
ncbi:divisome protein SepX/GlpR [Nocardia cyriacigeorgica]|uniref:divisome protein SepX/GlpR n=1 Tax=Nocardia cyriacigeorgica TaxID=135487 RepID=UPI00245377AE|nr:gephyrin-like molybdotransferase receptor GlpR [Nocardia cyriacigeorgica]